MKFEKLREPHKSHKLRNGPISTIAILGGGMGIYFTTQGDKEASPTTTPIVTTIDIEPTNPSDPVIIPTIPTIPSTTEAPTTTLEPKPTDVIEHRDGYDVLRNGGLLYEVESAPEFGGFELHMKSGGVTFGFTNTENGVEIPQEILYKNLLKTFGNQHMEFILPDGQVDIEAYSKYLSEHNWTDTVYLPENASAQAGTKMPPVKKSNPVELDFKKPFVIGNTSLSLIDGLSIDSANYFKPTPADNANMVFGINNDRQLFYGYYEIGSNGQTKPLTMKAPYESYPISFELGDILNITGRITYPEDTPQNQWLNPARYYRDPFLVNPTGVQPPYPTLNVLDFVGVNEARTKGTNKLFAPVE